MKRVSKCSWLRVMLLCSTSVSLCACVCLCWLASLRPCASLVTLLPEAGEEGGRENIQSADTWEMLGSLSTAPSIDQLWTSILWLTEQPPWSLSPSPYISSSCCVCFFKLNTTAGRVHGQWNRNMESKQFPWEYSDFTHFFLCFSLLKNKIIDGYSRTKTNIA